MLLVIITTSFFGDVGFRLFSIDFGRIFMQF